MTPRRAPLSFDEIVALASTLPGVEVSTSYGTPALKVKGKLMARLWEDGITLVLKVPFVVRDHLMSSAPSKYFITDHYKGYPYVLVRLDAVRAAELQPLLEESWRQAAPTRMVAQRDAGEAKPRARRQR